MPSPSPFANLSVARTACGPLGLAMCLAIPVAADAQASGTLSVSGHVAPRCWMVAAASRSSADRQPAEGAGDVRCSDRTLQVQVQRGAPSSMRLRADPLADGLARSAERLVVTVSPRA